MMPRSAYKTKSNKMVKVASNEVVVGEEKISQCVVEISSGVVTNYYHFEEEQSNTLWLGGIIIVRKDKKGILRAYKNGNKIQ